MPHITELSTDELRVAGDAIETLLDLRAYMPADGTLVPLAAKFRDDIRDALGMPRLAQVEPVGEHKKLKELDDKDITGLASAVIGLLYKFRPFIGNPDLVTQLEDLYTAIGVIWYFRAEEKEEAKAS